MHPDKWQEIKEKIKNSMEVLDERTESNEERKESTEIIEFKSPLGKMKLEWVTRPKLLDKKTHFSRRIGGEVKVDYVYADNEFTHTLKIYQEDGSEDWQEMKSDKWSF
ncbi:hypothetical protein KKF32_01470 [Patescibacteria group bacterium]|nr:hypothetical protein [Patescibacteria group bacterium]